MKSNNRLKRTIGIALILIGVATLIIGMLLFMFSQVGSILWIIIISVVLNVAGINVLIHKSSAD